MSDETKNEPKKEKKNTWIIILAVVLGIAIIALLATIIYRGIISRSGTDVSTTEPAETTVAVATETVAKTTDSEKATAVPTKAIEDQTSTATNTPTTAPSNSTAAATLAPKKDTTSTEHADTLEAQIVNVVENGGFEWDFGEDGVASPWERFSNGGAKYIFMPEPWDRAIRNGDQAQRITIYEAHLPNRYAGIYQRFPVESGQTYQLTLYGQIRSGVGDIDLSQHGYKMQYAVDWAGGVDWQAVPEDEWVELPWDEQLLDGADVEFLKYNTEMIPPNSRMTLFIRAWNKWPDPVEAQYTLDTLSLVGPKPQQVLLDQGLPPSGGVIESVLPTDPIFWGSLLFLLFLVGGAAWRFKNIL